MRRVHLIGIGGSGLSGIGRVLLESGYKVSGSDRQMSPLARSLQEAGVTIFIGHSPENISGAELVIRSSAIPEDNVEVAAARAEGIPVLKRADFLGEMMAGRVGIAIAGTHGKTTTTAMIAWILTALGQDPTFIIGGVARNLGVNARAGKGKPFVIEADEYDRMFLGLKMRFAVVTHVEHDHPDCFHTPQEYYQAFLDFAGRLPEDGLLLACVNDTGAARLLQDVARRGRRVMGYGIAAEGARFDPAFNPRWVYRAVNLTANSRGGYTFEALRMPDTAMKSASTASIRLALQVPGEHNVKNALAALAVTGEMGLSLEQAARSLGEFSGTGRRFELVGEAEGITIVDDYAHHPTEIRATLQAARMRYGHRPLWVVWQPHTYSRTRAYFDQFVNSFGLADHVVVTDVYAAREQNEDGFSAQQIVAAMRHPDVHFVASINQATVFLLERLHSEDVLIVMSAGDADQISTNIYASLRERNGYDSNKNEDTIHARSVH